MIAAQFDAPRSTDATFGGTSLLAAHHDATIIISTPTAVTLRKLTASATPSRLWTLASLTFTVLAGTLMQWGRRR
jgi:hypothetical protein